MIRQNSDKLRTKNYVVLILTIVFITFCLSGHQPVSAASKIDTSKPVEIKWYVIGFEDQTDKKIVTTAVNKYLKSKINATLELTTFNWVDYENKMRIIMAAAEPYDINFTASWAAEYQKYARLGYYTNITEMLDIYAPKTKALLGGSILSGAKVDGKIYALPSYNNSIIENHGILLNKKLVQKYKVDTTKIKKLQDLESTFKIIKAKEPKIINFYPFYQNGLESVYSTLNYDKITYGGIPGAVIRDGKSTKVINEFESVDAKSLFSLMNKWYKIGYINKSSKDYDFFDDNKSNIFATYSKLNPILIEDLLIYKNIDMIPINLAKPVLTTNILTSFMQAISSMSKNPDRALMFLELVNTDEKLANMINYGIEGVHYEKTGAKSIFPLYPRNEDYNPRTPYVFGNESIIYSLPGRSPQVWNKIKEYTNNALASPLLGFTFNPQPINSKIQPLQDITNKYFDDLSMGKIDSAIYLPKMNSELKKAGLQQVLAEMQRQVDAFTKNNK